MIVDHGDVIKYDIESEAKIANASVQETDSAYLKTR